jgi:plasmid stabilization system protein ParE
MAHEIKWTRRASLDLAEIQSYISERRSDAAIREAGNILRKVDLLAAFPLMGSTYRRTARREYRSVVCGNYRIVYHVDGAERAVYIATVWHGAQDHPDLP